MKHRALSIAILAAAAVLGPATAPAYYHFITYLKSGNAPEKFDLTALPNKTVAFFVSESGPLTYTPPDTFNSVLSQIAAGDGGLERCLVLRSPDRVRRPRKRRYAAEHSRWRRDFRRSPSGCRRLWRPHLAGHSRHRAGRLAILSHRALGGASQREPHAAARAQL